MERRKEKNKMSEFEEREGKWRTIRGRRIFIAKGESLGQAMAKSGKFNRSDIRETKEGLSTGDRFNKTNSRSLKERQKAIHKMQSKSTRYSNSVYTPISRQDEKLVANQDAHIEGGGQTRVQRNWNKYSEEDRREHRHELIQKKLADYKAKKQSNNKIENVHDLIEKNIERDKKLHDEGRTYQDYQLEQYTKGKFKSYDDLDKHIENQRQSNNKIETEYPRAQGATKFEDLGLDIKDKKAFSDYLQDKYGTDDFRIINFDNKENAKQIYEDFKNKDNETFIQHNTQHGGTREYNKQELDRMAEVGTKPMKNSYSGYGWEGTKYDSKLSTKDIAKNITEYSKKEFPDVKLARKTDYNGVDIYVTGSDKDLYITDKDIDNYSNKELVDMTNNYGNQMFFDRWAKDNVPSYTKEHTFTADDVRRYMKEDLARTRQHEMNVSGNEYFLSDYGKKVISGLNKEMNSYNYDDSDGMIDYFNTNFYGYVHIGKSGKPYQVNESKKIKDYVSKKKSNH